MVDENWVAGKDLKPVDIELTREQLKQFVTFVSEARPTGDYEIYLGLSRRDVEKVKAKLGIDTPADARDFYDDVFKVAEARQEAFYAEEVEKAKTAQELAEARLRKMERENADKARERREAARSVLNEVEIKNEDAERQKRFEAEQAGEFDVPESDWRLPDDTTPDQFQHLLETRGWKFTQTMFNASKSDLVAESKRLGLNVDFDLVPR